jgi:hypothetical protein
MVFHTILKKLPISLNVGTGYYIIAEKDGYSPEPYSHSTFTLIFITRFLNKKMNKSNLLIVFLIAIVSYSCSDPAITDDLLDGNVILIRHYTIPNNS